MRQEGGATELVSWHGWLAGYLFWTLFCAGAAVGCSLLCQSMGTRLISVPFHSTGVGTPNSGTCGVGPCTAVALLRETRILTIRAFVWYCERPGSAVLPLCECDEEKLCLHPHCPTAHTAWMHGLCCETNQTLPMHAGSLFSQSFVWLTSHACFVVLLLHSSPSRSPL